jgi:hypothetical protein
MTQNLQVAGIATDGIRRAIGLLEDAQEIGSTEDTGARCVKIGAQIANEAVEVLEAGAIFHGPWICCGIRNPCCKVRAHCTWTAGAV